MNDSCVASECVTVHVEMGHVWCVWMCHALRMNETRLTYRMRHVWQMDALCLGYGWVTSYTWMRRVLHVNESHANAAHKLQHQPPYDPPNPPCPTAALRYPSPFQTRVITQADAPTPHVQPHWTKTWYGKGEAGGKKHTHPSSVGMHVDLTHLLLVRHLSVYTNKSRASIWCFFFPVRWKCGMRTTICTQYHSETARGTRRLLFASTHSGG